MSIQNQPQIMPFVREDSTLSQNLNAFNNQYQNDSTLMRDIVLFLCDCHQNSRGGLFNDKIFDVSDFCKRFNYKRSNLQALHESPIHVQRLKERQQYELYREKEKENQTYHIFESYLENALYRLVHEPFSLDVIPNNYYRLEQQILTEYRASAIQILNSVTFTPYKTLKNQTKHFYKCSFTLDFETKLYHSFTKIKVEMIAPLRQLKVDNFYIYLTNLKDILQSKNETTTLGSQSTFITFDILTEKADIAQKIPFRAKAKLINKFDELMKRCDLNLELIWHTKKNGDARIKYTPEIKIITSSTTTEPQMSNSQQRCQFWIREFYRELVVLLNINDKSNPYKEVGEYITGEKFDYELVKLALKRSNVIVFKELTPFGEIAINKLLLKLPKSKSTKEIEHFFYNCTNVF